MAKAIHIHYRTARVTHAHWMNEARDCQTVARECLTVWHDPACAKNWMREAREALRVAKLKRLMARDWRRIP